MAIAAAAGSFAAAAAGSCVVSWHWSVLRCWSVMILEMKWSVEKVFATERVLLLMGTSTVSNYLASLL